MTIAWKMAKMAIENCSKTCEIINTLKTNKLEKKNLNEKEREY